ncbi:hypothetical protein ACIP9H_40495 [Streptomyces sp. NPDC088732]|uniref:hypothetical protein n=1 Tax=Streptomyces sp. NPDC088732 TaxID=3365879 RepID=UPI0038299378
MARIRVLEGVAGDDFSWAPGDLVDLPDDEAAAWADGHRAQWADAEPEAGRVEAHPRVVTTNGDELVVVEAVVEPVEDTGADPAPVRWLVTVEAPTAAPKDGEDDVPTSGEPFDPSEHNAADVLGYLATVGEAEALRVLDAEAASAAPRKGIAKERDAVLEQARARDAEQAADEQQATEKAAQVSRGGGRGDEHETR